MKTLKIETGKKDYDLGGKVTVSFCPTDLDFVERAFNAFKTAEAAQVETEAELKGADAEALFDIARKRDGEMREIVNSLLETDVCTPLFGTMNTFARADGMPLWANVIMAVLDQCYDELPDEEKATRARIKKYTKKYTKAPVRK